MAPARPRAPSPAPRAPRNLVTEIFGIPVAVILGPADARARQRLVLCHAEPWLAVIFGLHGRGEFRPRRLLHARRLRRAAGPAAAGHQLLAGADRWRRWWSGCWASRVERLLLRRLYRLDPLYGLLLTFGLALIAEGSLHQVFGAIGAVLSGARRAAGAFNLGFMFLPMYRAWVILASLVVCFSTWFVIERTRLGATLRAATENAPLVQAFGINVPLHRGGHLRRRRGARGTCRRAGLTDRPGELAHGHLAGHRRVRGRGHRRHGFDLRLDRRAGWRWASSRDSLRSSIRKPPTSSCSSSWPWC